MKNLLVFIFFITNISFSQSIEYVGMETSANFDFYRVYKKQCPGYISHNDCLRFIDLKSNDIPQKKFIYKCDTDLLYRLKPQDTLVLISNVDDLFLEIKNNYKDVFKEIGKAVPFEFSKWEEKKLVDKSKYKLYSYSASNVKYLVFKVRASFLNEILFENNILVKKPILVESLYLKIPIE